MSIFSKIVGAAKGALGGFIGGGQAGAVVGGIGGFLGGGKKKLPSPPGGAGSWTGTAASRVRRVLPGAGTIAAGVAGYAGGKAMQAYSGGYAPRRRTRGFSSRDVRQAKRLMKMLKDVSAAAPKPRTIRAATHCN